MVRAGGIRALVAAGLLLGAVGGASAQDRAVEDAADRLEALADEADRPIPEAGAAEVALACRLRGDFLRRVSTELPRVSQAEHRRLQALVRSIPRASLPARARCAGTGVVAFQPGRFGASIDVIGRGRDGRFVLVGGGVVLAPLAGHGIDCVYARRGAALVPAGCIRSWVS